MNSDGASNQNKRRRKGKRVSKNKLAVPCDKDTFRILVTTDNHLGYNENDPVRGQDSFDTFEEILQIGADNDVDFVLLGGDLFHENKPSRQSLYKAMQILRKFCYGDGNVNFQIVSDQRTNFPDTQCVNYEDPNVNINLPVFAIHGNHDDPAGVGGFSAMDLLNSVKLLNYFGKANQVDDIDNVPILMQKGASKLCLYGLGNIRDERLNRTFQANKVKWVKPARSTDEWFNLAVLHQNRTKHTQHGKNYIAEKMLPDFLDLVVWGHEHECLIDLEESVEGSYLITQPGSSVATSLSQGESRNKQVCIIEIRQSQYRQINFPLKTVRPFVMEDIRLSDWLLPDEPNIEAQVEEHLSQKVQELLEKAKQEALSRQMSADTLPLLRLRVDHTGFPKINANRFGAQFIDCVANPDELLIFHKQRKPATKSVAGSGNDADSVPFEMLAMDQEDAAPAIHSLVSKFIRTGSKLNLLSEAKLAAAVQEFVDKRELSSISTFVTQSLEAMQISLNSDENLENQNDIERLIQERHEAMKEPDLPGKVSSGVGGVDSSGDLGITDEIMASGVDGQVSDVDGRESSSRQNVVVTSVARKSQSKRKSSTKSTSNGIRAFLTSPTSSNQRESPARAGRRSRRNTAEDDADEVISVVLSDDEEPVGRSGSDTKIKLSRADQVEILASDDDMPAAPSRNNRRNSTRSRSKGNIATRKSPRKRKAVAILIDDDDDDEIEDVDDIVTEWGQAEKKTKKARRRSRRSHR